MVHSEGNGFFDYVKYIYSTAALCFSISLVMGLIFTEQTPASDAIHPAVAFIAVWLAIIWLTVVEGGQASMVGLAPVAMDLYKDTHPKAYQCCKVVHKGDNFFRYLMGRQFLVVLVVFTVNMCGGPMKDAELWGMPDILTTIFISSGVAMILFTCMAGQLNSECNASLCMLDYTNNYIGIFTVWVSMAVEFSGILHSAYLVNMIVLALAGKKNETNEPPRNVLQNIWFWGRVLMSLTFLALACTVVMTALFEGKTTVWGSIPPGAAVPMFLVLLCCVGNLEAIQIAFFAVAKLPMNERGSSIFARKTAELLFEGQGRNLPRFMIGRQLCVVSCMFFVARVTTVDVDVDAGEETLFGVSKGMQKFLNTGLLSALIVTIIGSIAWRLAASAFPVAFMSFPTTYLFLRICLFLEFIGICHGAWVIAEMHKYVAGYQRDEVYIGTAEERAAKAKGDDYTMPHHTPMVVLPGFIDNAPPALQELMKQNAKVREYVESMHLEATIPTGEKDKYPTDVEESE